MISGSHVVLRSSGKTLLGSLRPRSGRCICAVNLALFEVTEVLKLGDPIVEPVGEGVPLRLPTGHVVVRELAPEQRGGELRFLERLDRLGKSARERGEAI